MLYRNWQGFLRSVLLFFLVINNLSAKAQNYDAEVINSEIVISINNGKLNKIVNYQIKIYNRAGEKYTKVRIPHSPISKASKIKAFITNVNGSVIKKISKRDIITKSAISSFSFYEDDLVKEFTLKHNRYPYILNYSYQINESDFVAIDYWTPMFSADIPTLKASFKVYVPSNYDINIHESNIEKGKISTFETTTKYKWEGSYNCTFKDEVYAPDFWEEIPMVRVVPINFNFDKSGNLSTWVSYGNWQYELNKGLSELPEKEKLIIDKLVAGVDNDMEKIKKLYHYLQDETRYVNISIETGGLKPYPASYVAQNKYGDCKALSNYFKSVLSYAGIKSFYTKIYADDMVNQFLNNFPSPQFNHIILCVPTLSDTLWLDCTSDAAFSYVGTSIQNREVFVIDKDKSFITRTPKLEIKDVVRERKIKLKYNSDLSANISFTNNYKGDGYESLLSLNCDYSENRKKQIVRNYIVEDNFELQDFSFDLQDRDSTNIKLEYSAFSRNYFQAYGKELFVKTIPFYIPNFEKVKDRTLPVQIDYPIYYIDTLDFEIPEGYVLNNLPKEINESNDYGKYSLAYIKNDKTIRVCKKFILNEGKYSIEQYSEFFRFIDLARSSEKKSILILSKN